MCQCVCGVSFFLFSFSLPLIYPPSPSFPPFLPEPPLYSCSEDTFAHLLPFLSQSSGVWPALEVIARLADGSRFSPFKETYGTSLHTGFAHINGSVFLSSQWVTQSLMNGATYLYWVKRFLICHSFFMLSSHFELN